MTDPADTIREALAEDSIWPDEPEMWGGKRRAALAALTELEQQLAAVTGRPDGTVTDLETTALIEECEKLAGVLSMEPTPFQMEQAVGFLVATVPAAVRELARRAEEWRQRYIATEQQWRKDWQRAEAAEADRDLLTEQLETEVEHANQVINEKVLLQQRLDDWKDTVKAVMAEPCGDEVHCTCVPALRADRDRLQAALDSTVDEIAREYVLESTHHAITGRLFRRAEAAEAEAQTLRDALEWVDDFAGRMLDRHTGFVHVQRRARAALTTPDTPPDTTQEPAPTEGGDET